MKLIEDKAQQVKKHILKNQYWKSHGVEVERLPLPCGDYILVNERVQDVIDRKTKRGVEIKKMDFLGTYTVAVDTKKDIQELIGDICGKAHERFRDECILAQNNGIKLYILVENEEETFAKGKVTNKTVRSIADLYKWVNKRAFIWKNGKQVYPNATKGSTLAKACETMTAKYGVEFLFCQKNESGEKVIELLTTYKGE